jgi:hypothetical protein
MIKTSDHTNGVIGVISLAQRINTEIGFYQEHFYNENFNFTFRLSNGRLQMSIEVVQDYETQPSSVTQERVQRLAGTFMKS